MSTSLASKQSSELPTPADVDEAGQLQAWLALMEAGIKPRKDRLEELEKRFAAAFDASASTESFTVEGKEFIAIIGPRGNRRSIIDIKKLYRVLTPPIFFKICSVPLGKLDALLDENKHKGLVEWARTGARSVDVVKKVSEPA